MALAAPTEPHELQQRTEVLKTAKAGLDGLLADGLPVGRRDAEIHRRKPLLEIPGLSDKKLDKVLTNGVSLRKRDVA